MKLFFEVFVAVCALICANSVANAATPTHSYPKFYINWDMEEEDFVSILLMGNKDSVLEIFPDMDPEMAGYVANNRILSKAYAEEMGEIACYIWKWQKGKKMTKTCFSDQVLKDKYGHDRRETTLFHDEYNRFNKDNSLVDLHFQKSGLLGWGVPEVAVETNVSWAVAEDRSHPEYPIKEIQGPARLHDGDLIIRMRQTFFNAKDGKKGKAMHDGCYISFLVIPSMDEIAKAKTAREAYNLGKKTTVFRSGFDKTQGCLK